MGDHHLTVVDISIGPTSASSLLTAGLIATINKSAPRAIPPSLVAAIVAFGVGSWSLLLGLLNFGFIFTILSNPVVDGFVMGLTQIIILGQVPVILGLTGISPVLTEQMGQIIGKIGQSKPASIGLGVTSIVLMILFGLVGQKFGRLHPIINLIASAKHIILIVVFAGVSFGINKDLEEPIWKVIGPSMTILPTPAIPNPQLLQTLFLGTLTIGLATLLEHIALARSFGTSKGYSIDPSQELVSLGVINIANSLFGGGPVGGGDLTRACFNSASGSRSPLSGLLTSTTVFVAMFSGGLLRYIPDTVIAGLTIITVLEAAPPMALLGVHWKVSFADFIVMLLAFNMSLVASGEIGIAGGVFVSTIYTLFRIVSTRPNLISNADLERFYNQDSLWPAGEQIPDGTQVVSIPRDMVYLNSPRIKKYLMHEIFSKFYGTPPTPEQRDSRTWNFHREKYIASLRRKSGINRAETIRFRLLILDFSAVSFIDITAMQMLEAVKKELIDYGGDIVEFRFVGMNAAVRKRFQRYGWKLASPYDAKMVEESDETPLKDIPEKEDLEFDQLVAAIRYQEGVQSIRVSQFDFEINMGKF